MTHIVQVFEFLKICFYKRAEEIYKLMWFTKGHKSNHYETSLSYGISSLSYLGNVAQSATESFVPHGKLLGSNYIFRKYQSFVWRW